MWLRPVSEVVPRSLLSQATHLQTIANYYLCQTTTSALENHCILYWAIYLLHCHIYIAGCTKLYPTIAVIRKFLATGSADMRDMGMDWSASSDRGLFITNLPSFWSPPSASTESKIDKLSLSKMCTNSEQNWNILPFSTGSKTEKLSLHQICVNSEHHQNTFTFITVNTTGKTFTFLNKEKERESSPYWSLAISSVTRSHGARLTNQGLLRHNFHFSGRKSKNQNIPSFHRLEY